MPERRPIDRATIIAAAQRILETEGQDALSMRRLATELDSKPMTLYHYVSSKSELLWLVMTEVAAAIDWSDPVGPPEQRMVAIAMDMADRLAEIPWILPILHNATHIGLRALLVTDRFLSAAKEAGATDLEAVSLWRSVWWLISSELVFRANLPVRADDGAWYERITEDDLPEVPTVKRLFSSWPTLSAAYDLRTAVAAQVAGTLVQARARATEQPD